MTIAVRSTAIGEYASRSKAEHAIGGLLQAGFKLDQVGIVLADTAALGTLSGNAAPPLWAGAMFRSLIGVEIPEDELRYYEEALEQGKALVMVRAPDRYPEAMDIIYRCGGEYLAEF